MPRIFTKLCLAAIILIQSILPSFATTYDPVEYIHPTDWYMEVFGGMSALRGARLRHAEPSSPLPGGIILSDSYLQPGFNIGPAFGAAFGFRYNHNLRFDGQYTYLHNVGREFCGSIHDSVHAVMMHDVRGDNLEIRSHIIMANAYYDFYPPYMRINPYLGLGFGVAMMKSSHFNLQVDGFPDVVDVPENRVDNRFAAQGTVGFNFPFSEQTWFDFRYRYLSTLSSTKFFTRRAQHHLFTFGMQGYLSSDRVGKLSASYDPVMGYQRMWFINGFGGVTLLNNADIPLVDSAFLNAGLSSPPLMVPLTASFRPGYDFGGAIGFYINPQTRLDLQFTHMYSKTKRSSVSFTDMGNAEDLTITADTWLDINSLMVNGNYEFRNFADRHVPYFGVGAGIARLRLARVEGVIYLEPIPMGASFAAQFLPAQTTTRFAYQVNAGVISQRSERLFIDFSYRYFNTGKLVFFKKRLENHLFNIGLTYLLSDPSEQLA